MERDTPQDVAPDVLAPIREALDLDADAGPAAIVNAINVLRGDMSLVGNRPIPLYEAERLTSDLHIARFFAPAGITGLWQITKKDKNNLSEEERKLLDIEYAASYNFWMDMRILLKTLPAALQHENA